MNGFRLVFKYLVSFLFLFIYLFDNQINAQNYIFSQTYSSPTIVSPSFTGLIEKDRLAINFRDQWPGLNHTYVSYALSYDHYSKKLKSGYGFSLIKDEAGTGDLGVTTASFMYSYELKINKNWNARPGMAFSYSERTIDFSKLTFPDEMSSGGNTAETGLSLDKRQYIDFAASFLAYTNKYWVGLTAEHLLRPNQGFILSEQAKIPIRYILLAGSRIPIRQKSRRTRVKESVTFTMLYRNQQMLDQLDIGAYYTKEPFVVGLWLRGLPIVSGFEQNTTYFESLIFLLGYQFGDIGIGYSFDFTVSKLLSNTAGAHEISLVYKFRNNAKRNSRKKYVAIPCPGF